MLGHTHGQLGRLAAGVARGQPLEARQQGVLLRSLVPVALEQLDALADSLGGALVLLVLAVVERLEEAEVGLPVGVELLEAAVARGALCGEELQEGRQRLGLAGTHIAGEGLLHALLHARELELGRGGLLYAGRGTLWVRLRGGGLKAETAQEQEEAK